MPNGTLYRRASVRVCRSLATGPSAIAFRRRHRSKRTRSAVIMMTMTHGSLGDEAILAGVSSLLRECGVDRLGYVVVGEHLTQLNRGERDEVLEAPDRSGRWIHFVRRIASYDAFYLVGADVLDGHYSVKRSLQRLAYVRLAWKLGLSTTVLGFSWPQAPVPAAAEAIGALPREVRLCARDPVSQGRLQQQLGREIELVADAAFLLKPCTDSHSYSQVSRWIANERTRGQLIVGLNPNVQVLGEPDEQRSEAITTAIVRLVLDILQRYQGAVSFVLIPHDYRGAWSDHHVVQSVYDRLDQLARDQSWPVVERITPQEAKAIAGELDLAVVGRMHLAVACLGQGTPCLAVGYQGKCEGLFQHFGLENMVLSPSEFQIPEVLCNRVASVLEQRIALRAQIQQRLPAVRNLARLNAGPLCDRQNAS
jgi:polysaccharide pyruvyl transferase WcaK-like protein